MKAAALLTATAIFCFAEVHQYPGGKEVSHEKFIRVVSEKDSPVQQTYIKTKDGLYVAAAIRKPKGDGPFPAFIQFHGAPGGRGMETLVRWSRGADGGPMWERYLQEGFVVVVADYRGGPRRRSGSAPAPEGQITSVDDGVSIVEYVRTLPYVDAERIVVYGGSLGGNLVLHLISGTKVQAAGVGAPAAFSFLAASRPPRGEAAADPADRWKNVKLDHEVARNNVAAIQCPLLIQVGTKDGLIHLARILHNMAEEAGQRVRLEIYENGPHGFYFGPQSTPLKRPMLDITLAALDSSVKFFKGHVR